MTKDKNQIQDDALKAIGSLRKAGVVASMGTGKCLLGLKHMTNLYHDNISFLIVAPQKTIQQSWIDDANKFGYSYLLEHISFSTYTSLNKHNVNNYDAVYLDKYLSITI